MSMRMRGGLATLQELHRALWSTYLRGKRDVDGGPQSLASALDTLLGAWDEVPRARPVVGTALWDLVRRYPTKRPPADLTTLLRMVLGFDLQRARHLGTEPAHADFPPFPRPMLCDSSFSLSSTGTEVDVSVCVEGDFDDMSVLAQPEEWPRLCPLFWDSVRRNGDGWDAKWHSPAMPGTSPLEVRLVENARKANKTEAMADLQLIPEGSFGQARLLFVMGPEEQKPGWTRLTHKRQVTFGPDVPARYRKGTLTYWTKSEIACLVFQ